LIDVIWKNGFSTSEGVYVAKAKKSAAPKKRVAKDTLLVGSKVKAAIKDANCNTASDAIEGLNEWVHWLIQQATTRATANGRKTVRAHDFMVV
jgi:histone H3/H4